MQALIDTVDTLRIATRQSKLALWQANHVAERLRQAYPKLTVELVGITTKGDQILDQPLAQIGGKGLFLKELEQALLDGRADIAVHSLKDVPAECPPGLTLPVVLAREDPRDAFISNRFHHPNEMLLARKTRVGTCSLRRRCQLANQYPDIQLVDLRGNVDTRLAKLEAGEFDAIVLAAAGLKRLGLTDHITAYLDPGQSLPAVGQGTIAIECREDDAAVIQLIDILDDDDSHTRVRAERAFNARLDGSCQVPLAGYAEIEGDKLYVRGLVGAPNGTRIIRAEHRGPADEPERVGVELAELLLSRGADVVLAAIQAEAD